MTSFHRRCSYIFRPREFPLLVLAKRALFSEKTDLFSQEGETAILPVSYEAMNYSCITYKPYLNKLNCASASSAPIKSHLFLVKLTFSVTFRKKTQQQHYNHSATADLRALFVARFASGTRTASAPASSYQTWAVHPPETWC